MLIGFALFLGFWYLVGRSLEAAALSRDARASPSVIKEWLEPRPDLRPVALHRRVLQAHLGQHLARDAGVLPRHRARRARSACFLGWSRKFKEYVFPVFETLRPIPILAWVPLAIVMFVATESAVIFLTFLASFFATALNTMLGVESIDESYVRAANCLGASKSAGLPPRDPARARCRSSSPACRSRSACPGSRSSPRRWCRASTASAT